MAVPSSSVAIATATGAPEKILRRNPKGCRSKDFYNWPEESFEEMDSTIAVQQYIQQKIRKDPSNIDEILLPPKGQDLGTWKYEHMRQFCLQLNRLTVMLQTECSSETCSQMTATEQWIFLCAAHKAPKECPAIDYTRHTLDGAAALLNSNKYFPSRVTIKESSVAKLGSVCRRVYRIFSHAYYHHKTIYDEFETQTFLCKRFSVFSIKYELMSIENLIVPIPGLEFTEIKKVTDSGDNGGAPTGSVSGGNPIANNGTNSSPLANTGAAAVAATAMADGAGNTATVLRSSATVLGCNSIAESSQPPPSLSSSSSTSDA